MIKCGEYKHYKEKYYTVYGLAVDNKNEEFVLYQQNYGDKKFWIRPAHMFMEKIIINGQTVQRFELLKQISEEIAMINLANILKIQNIDILHSETEQRYKIVSLDIESKNIKVIPF